MKGYLLFQEFQPAEDLINEINTCMGFPNGQTLTWMNGPYSFCSVGPTSAYTQFEAYAVVVDTEQISQCLTQEQIDNIIQKPVDWSFCV
jgi:hypothetical protein